MRYDKSIVFVAESSESHYDADLGEWVESEPKRTDTTANVTDLGTDRSVAIFGTINEGAKVIRTQPLFSVPKWDYIEYRGKTYQLVTERVPQERHSLIVQEVIKDG
ncbi:hypothetical protein UAY_01781 [Enterococcus moraviensis ATCC BAA-383]|uniref:Phage protein n=1 Tax=Enterococcus moraviensis ATCC BAA-383 TaxID=1158609 RepID=R2SZQ3_9ENTE|nr:hypothetical protein [Enterococcus moraviensis]EOI00678.1 hypothetical protein UAY_01781 [Enterococcus moraviensis ATCC BAA-383]EOT73093.1 hypothetical protein I586_00086 [Enterococcus moraviensis ATCC BAA-383]